MEMKRVLGYLKYTQDYTLHYNKYPAVLEGYSDANWITGSNEVKSMSGYVFTIGGGAVCWKSSKQTCIAHSIIESKFIALDKDGEESEWLRNFLKDISYCPKPLAPVYIHCDSQAAIGMVGSMMYNGKSHHIRRRHNTVREILSSGIITVDYVKLKDNMLDPLTKGLSREGVERTSKGMGLRPRTSQHGGFVLTEREVYGRDKEKDEIVKILINNVNYAQELSVLPILGMGGLGKTTLAQMVINDQRVRGHFNPITWVCVSVGFDEKRLIKLIVGNIEKSSLDVEDLASFQKKLQELLNGKRYLLVLDDVWNDDQEKWANLRAILNVGASGAFVLTTTRLEKVGSIMGTLQPYKLSNLSQEDCWLLFMQRAFGHQEQINPNLVAIGKEIVKKCGGVPLAAKTLGGILRFKREEREWEHVRDSEIWNLPQDESSILPALRLSYHHLPHTLRQCFVYCAVFPKDTKMEKENLFALWMAHGFLLPKGKLEPEDVGNEEWNELYFRSFFQEVEEEKLVKSDRVTYFKMHDLIHDLATSLFSSSTSSSNTREIKVNCYGDTMSIGFAEVVSSYCPSLLRKFLSLRVLNLSYSELEELPSSIGDLVHLRYLNMCGNNICSLPKRLCKLQNLQTLDLSYFLVGEKKGYQLGELRNLNLYGSISIAQLERVKNDTEAKEANLSAKRNLHSLSMSWDRDEPHRYESEEVKILEVLKPYPNILKSLKITGFRGIRLPAWINHSVLGKVVSIKIECCLNCSVLPPFGELPCLEILELHKGSAEYVEENDVQSGVSTRRRFPSLRELHISNFRNLKGLLKKEGEEQFPMLEEIEIQYCPMLVFPNLPFVKILEISGEADARGLSSISNLSTLTSLWIADNYKLPTSCLASLNALEYLYIACCDPLESLPEEGLEGLTSLTQLSVRSCKMLKSLPEGLQHRTALTSLTVYGSPQVKKRCEKGIGEDWHKIAHIPNVNID
ncbi:putative disease resistance protein RGA4 [Capsicum baccatum]|uniref:Disease resistance protein RGA4 n=1 Tax=Capsicum baccatum TaxID=33114 RepID=A0A2G2XMP4_CAPBA|nr:putative disease resistance protein RGA4 [Capsicum baccatum]